MGIKLFNKLPHSIKQKPDLKGLKNALYKFLLEHSFYSINEYFTVLE